MNTAPAEPAARKRRPWPRAHLIYFVLAAFDLLAVAGGLYLSHRLAGVFEDNAAVSEQVESRKYEIDEVSPGHGRRFLAAGSAGAVFMPPASRPARRETMR